MSVTNRLRSIFTTLLVLTVCAAVVGWFMDKDPAALGPVIMWITGAVIGGEASNVGKRATYNPDAP